MIKKALSYLREYGLNKTIKKSARYVSFRFRLALSGSRGREYKLTREDTAHVCMKKRTAHIFMNIPYHDVGGGQRGAQLSKTLNAMGFRVSYLYLYASSDTGRTAMELPTVLHKKISAVKPEEYSFMPDDICIFDAPSPEFLPFLEKACAQKIKCVYECIDNWETSLGCQFYSEAVLKHFLILADLITATSKPLVAQQQKLLGKYGIDKTVIYLPNAVDSSMFDPDCAYERPTDLPQGKKLFLYYGSLWGEWFDWTLVLALAEGGADVVLIGDCTGAADIVSKAPKNLHFLGGKNQYELPAYLHYCDWAIVPFKTDEIGRYVSPLKLFEYIAMGKPVLATPLDDINGYPNVHVACTPEDWKNAALFPGNTDDFKAFTEKNNWYSRCEELLQRCFGLREIPEQYRNSISVIVLNHNNKAVIGGCVDSLIRNEGGYGYEIIVVDNASNDGSYELLSEKYSGIKLLRNKLNGCSSGRNLGAEAATGKYLLFLDSDQRALYSGWLNPYITALDADKEIGAIGWTGGWFVPDGTAYRTVEDYPHRYMPPAGLYRDDIGYLGSGGLMIEKSLLDALGGFDTFYDPTCYEDTDLTVAVRHAGKKLVYCPWLGVKHLPHQTTGQKSCELKKLEERNSRYFADKWRRIDPKLLNYRK